MRDVRELATCDVCGERTLSRVFRPDPEAPAAMALCPTCANEPIDIPLRVEVWRCS